MIEIGLISFAGGLDLWQQEPATSNIYYDAGSVGIGFATPVYRFEVRDTLLGADAAFYINGTAMHFDSIDADAVTQITSATHGIDMISQEITLGFYGEYNLQGSVQQWTQSNTGAGFTSVINFDPQSWIAEITDGASTNVISLLPDMFSSQKRIVTDATLQTNAGFQWDLGDVRPGAYAFDPTQVVIVSINGVPVQLACAV